MMITSFSLESMANLHLEAGTQLVDNRSCFSFQCQWRQRIILKMALQVSRNVMMVFTSRELEMREPCRLEHSHQQNGPAGLTGTEHRHKQYDYQNHHYFVEQQHPKKNKI